MYLDTIKVLQNNELQRSYMWEVILPNDVSSTDSIEVSSYIQEVKFGSYNIADVLSLRFGPFQSFSAGFPEIGTVSMLFLSPADGKVLKYFQDWKDKIMAPVGYFFPKANYVRTAYCYLYDKAGNQKVQFKLVNIFPKTFPSQDLSYERSDFVKFNIEFVVDYVEQA